MSRFDEEPDADPHGECAVEIRRLQAEVNRLTEREAFHQTQRDMNTAAYAAMTRERDELRAKLAALEAQKPAYWVGQSGNLYAGRLFAVQNGEQMVTPLYLAAGAKP